jgi:hypothetical protein
MEVMAAPRKYPDDLRSRPSLDSVRAKKEGAPADYP